MVRATQTMASRQSLVRQALLACALERYRLAEGAYPDRLDALVPKYLATLPSDILSGATLKYRRNDQGGFLLYSVGWNERDDGGIPGNTAADGDWVWRGSEAH